MAVTRRVPHEQYTANPRTNDIGILVLTAVLTFDRFVQPIRLADHNAQMPMENEQLTVLGFGGFPGNTNRSKNLC